jgi:competence protein ComFC
VPASELHVFSSLLNLFFPARCRLCTEFIDQISRVPVCPACWAAVEPLSSGGLCSVCGLPAPNDLAERPGCVCEECRQRPPHFELARSYGIYGGTLRGLIHLLKYQGMTPLAQPLARSMAQVAMDPAWRESFARCAAIVALPLDPARHRERGYNQAELLARALSRHMAIPMLSGVCRRIRSTAPQAGLSRMDRHNNVRDAFAADKRLIGGRAVLLVDDVMTTGATLNSCAGTLRAAGAASVAALTSARTIQYLEATAEIS